MATITIKDVPETFVKKYFKTTFSYDEVKIEPKKIQKDPTIRLQKLLEDPENISYGPFDNAEDFLKHLHNNNDEIWK